MTDDNPTAGYRLTSSSSIDFKAAAGISINSNAQAAFVSSADMTIEAGGNSHISSGKSLFARVKGMFRVFFNSMYMGNSKARIKILENGDIELSTVGTVKFNCSSMTINATNNISLNASKINLN